MEKFLSQSEYAKHRNLSRARISQLKSALRQAGALTDSGRVNVAVADAYLDANLNAAKQRKRSKIQIPEGMTEAKARTANLLARTRRTELDLKVRESKLLDAEEVDLEAFNWSRAVRDSVLGVPDRVSAVLAGMNNAFEIRTVLLSELKVALEQTCKNMKSRQQGEDL